MTSEHELRANITNLRNHLLADVGKSNWLEVVVDVSHIEGYIMALRNLNILGKKGINKEDYEEAIKLAENVVREARDKDKKACVNSCLSLSRWLVSRFNIPPLIDQ